LLTIDAQKVDFLSHVSHELRTPMTSVRSFAELLRDNPGLDSDQRRRFATIIQAESLRLTRLIDEIHDLSFLESRDTEAAAGPIDPEHVLSNAIEIALVPFGERPVELRQDRRAGAVRVRIDPGRLSQVIINLIANAVLHNDKDEVVITVRSHLPEPGTYAVDIEDNGPGIPPGIRGRIFEPFFRGSPAGSNGLGLAISARIVESFGGQLAAGEAQRTGARLTLRLPTVVVADAVDRTFPAAGGAGRRTS
jgi:signal transduction histidine kinase